MFYDYVMQLSCTTGPKQYTLWGQESLSYLKKCMSGFTFLFFCSNASHKRLFLAKEFHL